MSAYTMNTTSDVLRGIAPNNSLAASKPATIRERMESVSKLIITAHQKLDEISQFVSTNCPVDPCEPKAADRTSDSIDEINLNITEQIFHLNNLVGRLNFLAEQFQRRI